MSVSFNTSLLKRKFSRSIYITKFFETFFAFANIVKTYYRNAIQEILVFKHRKIRDNTDFTRYYSKIKGLLYI